MWFFQNYIFQRDALKPWFIVPFKAHFFWKLHWNFTSHLEGMKMFFVNINYFHQFSGIFDISLLQTGRRHQHETDNLSIFFFLLERTLNRLFINFIKLFWIWISASWNIKRRSNRVKSGVFFFYKALNRS